MPWYRACLKEIEAAVSFGRKKLNDWECEFLKTAKRRIELGLLLSQKQEDTLRKLNTRVTRIERFTR